MLDCISTMRISCVFLAVACGPLLVGCATESSTPARPAGGSDEGNVDAPGTLQILERLDKSTLQQLTEMGNDPNIIPPEKAGVTVTHPAPKSGVTYYKITYSTTGVGGEPTWASGLLVVPDSGLATYPILNYNHSTETDRADVPSSYGRPDNDGPSLAIDFASQGYVVMAPDYIGLGDSPGLQRYCIAETHISAGVDMLRAGKMALAQLGIQPNGQLFLTGYSEGGSTTMQLHRHIEKHLASEFTVTASAPVAGPYDLPYSLREVIQNPSHVEASISSAEIAFLVLSYQAAYGNVYSTLGDVFQPPFAAHAGESFDGLHSPSEVLEIFSGPPLAVYQPAFVNSVMTNPADPFILALERNKAYNWADWVPSAPVKFYQGGADTEVPFHNSELAVDWLTSLGVTTELVNLGAAVDHGSGRLISYPLILAWFETLRQ